MSSKFDKKIAKASALLEAMGVEQTDSVLMSLQLAASSSVSTNTSDFFMLRQVAGAFIEQSEALRGFVSADGTLEFVKGARKATAQAFVVEMLEACGGYDSTQDGAIVAAWTAKLLDGVKPASVMAEYINKQLNRPDGQLVSNSAQQARIDNLKGLMSESQQDGWMVIGASVVEQTGSTGVASVNEGQTIRFTLTDLSTEPGEQLAYQLSGVSAEDIEGSGGLNGRVTFDRNGKAFVDVTLKADNTTEGPESLTLTVGGRTYTVAVNDTSLTPAKTFILTTDLDNIQGTAGNDTIIGNLTDTDGSQVGGDLEYADAVNGAGGADTMVLYTWGNANVDTTDYTISSVEKVVIQARNGQNADVTMDMAGVGGLESVEIVNFIGGESDVTIDSAPGVVVVDNFQNEGDNVSVNFADTVTSAEITLDDVTANAVTATGATVTDLTLNLNGVDDNGVDETDDNSYFGFTGDEESALASVTVNVTADSDVFLDFNQKAHANLASITINADADFTGGILLAEDANGNNTTTTLTINGAGDVNINGIWEDDVVDIVYTGSGSLAMGADEALDSVSGSFNASTATGDVTLYLDLNEKGVKSFEFMGSSGVNTVYIDDQSAANAVLDGDGKVDANVSIAIAAGDGTEDVLVVTDDADVAENVAGIYSGFETLRVESFGEDQGEGVDYDLTHLGADFEKIELVYNDADISYLGAVEVEVTAALADSLYLVQGMGEDSEIDLTLALDVSTAADDTMTVNFVNTDEDGTDDNAFNFADELTINGVESITLNSTGQVKDADENAQWNVIGEFNADQLRTLTITGDVNFAIDENLDADELYLIDATGFTGAELELGDISVGGGLEYRGSATADQNIDIRAFGDDVLVTTGSGDDNIQVDVFNAAIGDDVIIDAGDGDNRIDVDSNWIGNINTSLMDVVITAGDGDNKIDIFDVRDVTITLGDGNNNVDIFDVRDVTITLGDGNNNVDITYASGDIVVTTGSGDDDVRVDSNENWTSATINVGAGDDRVSLDMDNDVNAPTVEVTLGAGADVLDLFDVFSGDFNFNENGNISVDANYVVDVTDFDVTEDELELDGNNLVFLDAIVPDGEYDISALVDADETVVLEFAFEADNNGLDFAELYADGLLDGNALLEAIDLDLGNGVITYDDGSAGYLIAYNGGDAYLFAFADDFETVEATTDILAGSEIQLIGVFNDVAVGSFSASNFNIGAVI